LIKTVPLEVMRAAARIPKKADSLYALADAATDAVSKSQLQKYGQALEQEKLIRVEYQRRSTESSPALAAASIGYPSKVVQLGAAAIHPDPQVALKALIKIKIGESTAQLAKAVMHNDTSVRAAAIDELLKRKQI
jgi:hypothetical protein